MTMEALANDVYAEIKKQVAELLIPFAKRIQALEAKTLPDDLVRSVDLEDLRSGIPETRAYTDDSIAKLREEVNVAVNAVSDMVKAIPAGPQGPAGERGADGQNGKDGANGINGKDGAPGEPGARGETGEKGLDGRNGEDGRDGRDGEPGRDAVHIEVLDEIDPAKRYQRGTFAKYRGGLVRSFKATDPLGDGELELAGWHVVVEGLAEIASEATEDYRTLAVGFKTTSGKVVVIERELPVMVFKDTYRAGESYKRGDVVAWDGCSWVASQDDPASQPGIGKQWRLVAKRGDTPRPKG